MLKKALLSVGAVGTSYWLSNKKPECCGIVGVLSKKRQNVSDVLSQGIELLKNRGYDSAGIVTLNQQQTKTEANLVKYADGESQKNGNCIERVIKEVS